MEFHTNFATVCKFYTQDILFRTNYKSRESLRNFLSKYKDVIGIEGENTLSVIINDLKRISKQELPR
jgi:hypothetical protein